SVQAAKAGILEIADVFVVNKADREGADQTVRDLRYMLSLAERDTARWKPPIVKTVAAKGEGADDVIEALEKHAAWSESSGERERRRRTRAADEIEALAVGVLRNRMGDLRGGNALDRLAERVATGEIDPYAAADELVAGVTS